MKRPILLERLYNAYHANRIPVPEAAKAFFRSLSTKAITENAVYWEARARGENPQTAILSPGQYPELGAVIHPTRLGNPAALATIRQQEKQYHGSRRVNDE